MKGDGGNLHPFSYFHNKKEINEGCIQVINIVVLIFRM